jgi:hypothetical protein
VKIGFQLRLPDQRPCAILEDLDLPGADQFVEPASADGDRLGGLADAVGELVDRRRSRRPPDFGVKVVHG